PEAGFRNRAKMVAGGTAEAPTFGLLDEEGHGIDLSDCPLYPPAIHAVLAALPPLIRRAQVSPYDVNRRRGELKHVLVTAAPSGHVMVRFVLRTQKPVPRLAEHVGLLTEAVAAAGFEVGVVTANLQPEHAAVLEGPTEVPIAGDDALTVVQGRIPLRVLPQSFLQTNTHVASQLYLQVAQWVDDAEAASPRPAEDPFVVWDLFCGVGGFALHCARPAGDTSRRVIGVETSAQAVASATRTAGELGLAAEFTTADATLFATTAAAAADPSASDSDSATVDTTSADSVPGTTDAPTTLPAPHLLIVNPPRRGLGRQLADWIEASGISDVVYSSCNPQTLARDLAAMGSYRIMEARLLDMFPHTAHAEVVVRLVRSDADASTLGDSATAPRTDA
ncbi:MAG TPA: methyltransferase domain-containing protein, partial [Candidatus Brevibacterium intestinigallinarum]|nr:methyltransferase domain-containing protein [Candidatus Brevibacterium intestinigallinarum]